MTVLVADDDPVSRRALCASLERWGFAPQAAADGEEAWAALQADAPPAVAVLDWMMPGVDGLELCLRIRGSEALRGTYVILLTSRGQRDDLLAGLSAGADDYVLKPFDLEELRARIAVGARVAGLQRRLAERVRELESALRSVHTLQGLLPICAYCKSIRRDGSYWQQVESYLAEHSSATFSHGICPSCRAEHVEPQMRALRERAASGS